MGQESRSSVLELSLQMDHTAVRVANRPHEGIGEACWLLTSVMNEGIIRVAAALLMWIGWGIPSGLVHVLERWQLVSVRHFGRKFRRVSERVHARLSPRYPVHIFHHIPKCGGTSLKRVLEQWFSLVLDYRFGWDETLGPPFDLYRLRSAHCLCGHFELAGSHLFERYPEATDQSKFRVFSLVREPLELSASLFRYEVKNGVAISDSLEKHLFARPNYMAGIFGATPENYREVIDRYFFVGVLEHPQLAIDTLARMVGKSSVSLPRENATDSPRSAKESIPRSAVERFVAENQLDYAIYEYSRQRFLDHASKQVVAKKIV